MAKAPVPWVVMFRPPVPAWRVVVLVVFVLPIVMVFTAAPVVPKLMLSALASVPILIVPVVPESIFKVEAAAELRVVIPPEVKVTAPAPV